MKQSESDEKALSIDRQDLFALLEMRFGEIPLSLREIVFRIEKTDVLQRLILVAANVPDFAGFVKELQAGEESFRLVGEDFNPIAEQREGHKR